jgi:ABC-type nitrate/sulfonate/bicarbonate transport system substrate-binding protein
LNNRLKNNPTREEIMHRKPAPLSRAAVSLLFAGGAAFIIGAAATAARAADSAPLPIKVIELEPTPNPSIAFDKMAQAMDLFAKHGLALELGPDLAGGGPQRVQAVATNNTDVATGDIIAAFGGIYSGAKVKVLMVMTPYGDEEIWGQSKYKTMKDAEGQPWAIASLGGAQRFNAQMTVEGMGLEADAFKWLGIGGGDGPALEAVDTGRTQLASLSHLGAELAEIKGYTSTIHVIVPHTSKYTPPIPRLVVVARTDWLKDHEDAATRYVEMMLDMMRQFQSSGDAWVKPAEKIFSEGGLNPDQLHTVWQQFRDGGYFSVNGGINFAATQKVMDLYFKVRGDSPNEYLSKPADVYDTGPLKKALDKMGVAKGTPNLPDTPDWYKAAG